MAQFFGLIPLNADNFESGEAAAGQVLSADGSGGASWETVEGGGGGGGGAFDGVTLSNLQIEENYYYWDIVLTLNGDPITNDVAFMAYAEDDSGNIRDGSYVSIDSDGDYLKRIHVNSEPNSTANWLYFMRYPHTLPEGGERYIALNIMQTLTVRLCIVMPSGLVFKSALIEYIAA